MIRRLAALPSTSAGEFPQAIRALVESIDDPETMLSGIAGQRSTPRDARFAALYGWLLRLRREERQGEYAQVVSKYQDEFGSEPYFYTFRAIVERNQGDTASLRNAVELSREAAGYMPDVAGVLHQVGAFATEYCERIHDKPSQEELKEAEKYVDKAISLSGGHIGHYYETKARVLAIRREFEAARAAVTRALELEPRDARDYQRRLVQYQTTRIKIDFMEQQERWSTIQDESRRELLEFKTQQLQLLGLLAAVVAFVATAGSIASRSGSTSGVELIQVMAGSVIVVFATFSLRSSRIVWRVIMAYLIGAVLLIVPILVGR